MGLLIQAGLKFSLGLIFSFILVFVPAGTWKYFNGWLFIGLLFIPMLFLGILLWLKAPKLLEKRLRGKEEESEQKKVVVVSGLLFILGFILAGLDYRFGWSELPDWLVAEASVLLLISYGLYAEVMRENSYLSRTVEIQEGQKVIDTGLYGIVRHPMYMASSLLFVTFPLVLGSAVALPLFLLYPLLLAKRIKNEEALLLEGLPGYAAYCEKVRCRMLPFLW